MRLRLENNLRLSLLELIATYPARIIANDQFLLGKHTLNNIMRDENDALQCMRFTLFFFPKGNSFSVPEWEIGSSCKRSPRSSFRAILRSIFAPASIQNASPKSTHFFIAENTTHINLGQIMAMFMVQRTSVISVQKVGGREGKGGGNSQKIRQELHIFARAS